MSLYRFWLPCQDEWTEQVADGKQEAVDGGRLTGIVTANNWNGASMLRSHRQHLLSRLCVPPHVFCSSSVYGSYLHPRLPKNWNHTPVRVHVCFDVWWVSESYLRVWIRNAL